jgi:hypothetical protein
MLAGNAALEPLADELDDLVLELFRLFRPLAKAFGPAFTASTCRNMLHT